MGARALAGAAALALAAAPLSPALAARPSGHGGGGGGGGGSTTSTGNDVSYPQCGGSLPSSPAFGIVGVNDGLANTLNPCLGPTSQYPSAQQSELYWAVSASIGAVATQPKASMYVNTADPGDVVSGAPIADWPTSGSTPYGSCTTVTATTSTGTATVGANSPACAWEYGDQRAQQDATWLADEASAVDAQSPPVAVATGASAYPWWLDVETANSWQSGTAGQEMNVADLQGMIAALEAAGVPPAAIGAYSTGTQWSQVTGGTTTSGAGSLFGIPDWIPGARTLSGARSNCSLASFTGGRVALTQWASHPDGDYACP